MFIVFSSRMTAMMKALSIFLLVFYLRPCDTWTKWFTYRQIKSETSIQDQEESVRGLITRLLHRRASEFTVIVDLSLVPLGQEAFTIETVQDRLVLKGTTGVAVGWAFHHYLKYFCEAHISWNGNQLETIPTPLPRVTPRVKIVIPHRFRYYQNVCTSSYSFVWWNWTRWEQEIDWMVMNGINLPLAFTGQETIWQRIYKRLGLTQQELDEHFAGPAFLAWSRMGNVKGWGGPLPNPYWYQRQLALQHKIIQRMRSFGMIPVLPAFAGHVPKALARVFPHATMTTLSRWSHFSPPYVPTYLLDPNDELFKTIGKMFIEEQIHEYNGTGHIYNGDTFNELRPNTSSPSYLSQTSRAVYEAMASGDDKAVWLMQGWMFLNDPKFWQSSQVQAYLQGVPKGKMIVLDLYAEISPIWKKTNSFYGQPFIWCMLHNFGGNIGMHGTLHTIATEPVRVHQQHDNMLGIGVTPEGIETNYVVYDLMLEMGWRDKQVQVGAWLKKYTKRRYGGWNQHVDMAWKALARSVYNDTKGFARHCKAVPVMKPSLNIKPDYWYEPFFTVEAWDGMIKAAPKLIHSTTFSYDLVDITRQFFQSFSYLFYQNVTSSYKSNDLRSLQLESAKFIDLFYDLDLVLSSNRFFLLGRWLNAAKRMAHSPTAEKLLEFNARNQITTWGPHENIEDYANKMWSGLVKDFYKQRWAVFVGFLMKSLIWKEPFNLTAYNDDIMKFEKLWTTTRVHYPEHAQTDTLKTVMFLYKKYRKYGELVAPKHF